MSSRLSKCVQIGALAATILAGGYFAAKEVNKHTVERQISNSIERVIGKNSQDLRRQIMDCILGNQKNGKSGQPTARPFSTADISGTEYKVGPFEASIKEVNIEGEYGGYDKSHEYKNAHICPTSYGDVYYDHNMNVNGGTCIVQKSGDLTLVIPLAKVSDEKIPVIKTSHIDHLAGTTADQNLASPQLYLTVSNRGYGFDTANISTGISIAIKLAAGLSKGSEDVFIEIPMSEEINKQMYKGDTELKKMTVETINTFYGRTKRERAESELKSCNGDVHKLLENYVRNLTVYYDNGTTEKYANVIAKERPNLIKKLEILYQYLLKTAGPDKKNAIIEMLYRFFKCRPIRTVVDRNLPSAGYTDSCDYRKIELRKSDCISKAWLHEIVHKITLENVDCRDYGDYKNSSKEMFTEGIAKLSNHITDPASTNPSIKQSHSWGSLEQADFSLLTAAFLGKEGYVKSIIEEGGFEKMIFPEFGQNIDKFMQKWKINPKYRKDLIAVFYNGDTFSHLKEIKVDRKKNQWNLYSGERLFVLRRIIEANNINWKKFVAITCKEFDIPPIQNSFDWGYEYYKDPVQKPFHRHGRKNISKKIPKTFFQQTLVPQRGF